MKKVPHKNICHTGAVHINVEPHTIPTIRINLDLKTKREYVKVKLHRNPTSENWTCINSKQIFLQRQARGTPFA